MLLGEKARASGGGGHHGPTQIPWSEIGPQIFNFSVFFLLLFYMLRKPVINFFSGRVGNYQAALDRASQALNEAKARKGEISENLRKLKADKDKSILQAENEAKELKMNMVAEAKSEAKKIVEEAARTIQVETEKAKSELRNFMLMQAISMADKDLNSQLDESEQKRLQKEFTGKI